MILDIVKYGSPVLRKKGARIEKITPEIAELIRNMFETLSEAKGVGLAAQQVGHALQVAVLDVRDVPDRPSTMEINGTPVAIEDHMPVAVINPEIIPVGEKVAGPEGCLSFPEIFSDITRPSTVDVRAIDQNGNPIAFRCGGLLARAVQHEVDHLNGILFIDRMPRKAKDSFQDELDQLQEETKAELKKKTSARR
jgi:peptide deformylase